MRDIRFRYIIVRGGADYSEIHALEGSPPSLRMAESGEIKMSMSGYFMDPGDSVDWMSDQIRPEMILDGTVYPLGVYLPATIEVRENAAERSVYVEAYDRCWMVQDHCAESSVYFAAGSNYIEVVESLLAECGIALILKTETTETLAEAREDWTIGTSYLTIINQLLDEINYNPLWFNESGLAVLEPASSPNQDSVEHVLSDRDPDTMVLPTFSRKTDIYRSPNVFIAVCSNADKSAPMVARAENTNPQSPLSIQRRGRRISSVKQVDNISSQNELQAYADRLLNESLITGEEITVQSALLPGFGVADVTGLEYGDVFTICIERAWTMQLCAGGVMTHTLEKVVLNLE